ncbi:glycosyltransferase [Gloeobacter morelensis]|uniref:Glycosyl transferase n=1 Tax=Gloeobacter morelensis MG652769 TaxID=2781736 RepID=A0ABY3PIH3_9CYAN|nr:nucleotide disphospho-sugar-binding domain-containing protein [Gloeobacter morelensis]UFP93476.1 glycosyl transferase [Gloeobacter morelensis MG652769]
MARFLIGTVPVIGHVGPAAPIARKLVEHGHEVWWYTGKVFQPTVEATGARFAPIANSLDYSDLGNVPEAWIVQRNALQGLDQLKFDLKHFFIDTALGQVQDLQVLLGEFPADVLLVDSFFLGAAWVHELGGPPWAEYGSTVLPTRSRDTAPFGLGLRPNASPLGQLCNRGLHWLFQSVLLRDVQAHTNAVRNRLGLRSVSQAFFDVTSPFLYLQGTVPAFEYPRGDLPAQVHFVGPLLPAPPAQFTPPSWWEELHKDRPVVHVTQGTVTTEPSDLIVPTLRALQKEDVLVVATTGGRPVEDIGLAPLPDNARVERFIPHYHLLPHIDVMVTNGGYNGVQMALAHGIPLVVAGRSEDKPEVAARVAWAGVGIDLRTKSPKPERIASAIKQLITNSTYKNRARRFQTEMERYDAPARAVALLEQLAQTGRPVLSDSQQSFTQLA